MALENTLKTLLEELRQISRTETVVGKEIKTAESVIIPVSQIKIGVAGGGATPGGKEAEGIGGGLSVTPIAFIVVTGTRVQLLPMNEKTTPLTKVIELVPEVIEKIITAKEKKEGTGTDNEKDKAETAA